MLPCNRRDGNSSDGDAFQYSASEDAAVQENSLESGNEVDHSQEGQLSKPKSLEAWSNFR